MTAPTPATPDPLFLVTDLHGHKPAFNATLGELGRAMGVCLTAICALLRVGESRIGFGGSAGLWRVTRVE